MPASPLVDRTPLRLPVLLLIVLATGCGSVFGAVNDASGVRLARVPDGGIQPQACTDEKGNIHLVYFKGEPMHGDLFYVRSQDGGRTFGTPLRVNSEDGSAIAVGTIRGAHVAMGKNGRVHVAWMGSDRAQPRVNGKSTPMLYTRLNDTGDGFEPQRNIIQKRPGLDGGGSIAADAEGNVYIGWHAPKDRKDEEDRHVWLVHSADEGKTFSEERQANPDPTGVCGCCSMRMFVDIQGNLLILYRSATEMVNRDMYLLASKDKGRTFTSTKIGPWKIGQCAMSTAAMTDAPSGGLIAAWEEEWKVVAARFDPLAPKPDGVLSMPPSASKQRHPVAAVNAKGQLLVAWSEGTGWNKGGSVAWQVFDASGAPRPGEAGRQKGIPVWSMPAAVSIGKAGFLLVY